MTVVKPSSEAFLGTRPQKSAESGETSPYVLCARNDGGFQRDARSGDPTTGYVVP